MTSIPEYHNTPPDIHPDTDQMIAMIEALHPPGALFEERGLKPRRGGPSHFGSYGTIAGFFSDACTASHAVQNVTGRDVSGVYITLNQIDPVCANWGYGSFQRRNKLTDDNAVTRIRNILVDVDPVRPEYTCATDDELKRAVDRRNFIGQFLVELGWPRPVWVGLSGSGGTLVFRTDLPIERAPLIERALKALDQLHSDDQVKVDTTVFNPARIVRLAGTVNAKSPTPQPDRPWRLAKGRALTDFGTVTEAMVKDLAAWAPEEAPRPQPVCSGSANTMPDYDVPALLHAASIGYREKRRDYGVIFELDQCLTSNDHDTGASIIKFPNGAVGYRCLHARCSDKRWADIKPVLNIATASATSIRTGKSRIRLVNGEVMSS